MAINMKLPTVMKGSHVFSQVPSVQIPRSTFDRSHGYKTVFNAGYLVPFYRDEILPGDTFNCKLTAFVRLATPLKPIMDNLYFDTHFFFVPLRLIWDHFQAFMGEQEPSTFTVYNIPVFNSFVPAVGSLSDYLGVAIDPGGSNVTNVVSLYHRAYNLIYNQWYRDENLIASAVVDKGDGPDTIGNYVLRKRGKRHDYFTSCLPWPQKAAAAVSLPLGTSAPVIPATSTSMPLFLGGTSAHVSTKFTAAATANPSATQVDDGGAGNWTAGENLYWQTSGLLADLTNATAATINAIRLAFQTQKFLERDARGGTRYIEKVLAHFGVRSPDARLQRAEYLGGGSTPIIVNPVAQTTVPAANTNLNALGNLGGVGTCTAIGHGFSKSFTEHGIVMGIMNVRADLTYSQGMPREFFRSTVYDLYWPEFAHIGEQVVYNKEIYYDRTNFASSMDLPFGYQERYAEYRYKPSQLTNLFRPAVPSSLGIWHVSEQFGTLPTLAQTFIEDQTHTILGRVVAVNTEPDFYFDSRINLICARPMPVFGVPGMIDHF